jgi:pyrimidine operon attenuation protein/uracil phosphoribosyltransferase
MNPADTVKAELMDAKGLDRTLARLAREIVERNHGTENLAIVGIRTRGVPLAERLIAKIAEFEPRHLPLGVLDITLYRDDLLKKMKKPRLQQTAIPFDIDDKVVVLVDDVLYTGRTIRAAMDALMDFGRPAKIQLAVLVDRGQRELPINADFSGVTATAGPGEEVRVQLDSIDGRDGVYLVEAHAAAGP